MIHLLIHHEVADYPTWKSVFDSSYEWRQKNGERNCRLFHIAGNVNSVVLLFEWDNLESARAFMGSDELKARMAKAGVKGQPRIEILTEMQTVRRSAAD